MIVIVSCEGYYNVFFLYTAWEHSMNMCTTHMANLLGPLATIRTLTTRRPWTLKWNLIRHYIIAAYPSPWINSRDFSKRTSVIGYFLRLLFYKFLSIPRFCYKIVWTAVERVSTNMFANIIVLFIFEIYLNCYCARKRSRTDDTRTMIIMV